MKNHTVGSNEKHPISAWQHIKSGSREMFKATPGSAFVYGAVRLFAGEGVLSDAAEKFVIGAPLGAVAVSAVMAGSERLGIAPKPTAALGVAAAFIGGSAIYGGFEGSLGEEAMPLAASFAGSGGFAATGLYKEQTAQH